MLVRQFIEENITIIGPAGQLEAKIASSSLLPTIGIFCHPHPLHEGTFNNKVVSTVLRAWYGLGLSTLRFNFRGVGKSQGEYSHGEGEVQDLLAVLTWVKHHYPKHQVWVGGFSFGSAIAYAVAKKVSLEHLLLVAPPIDKPYFQSETEGLSETTQLGIIQGQNDDLVEAKRVLDWYCLLQSRYSVNYIEIQAADHFFHGKLPQLKESTIALAPLSPVVS